MFLGLLSLLAARPAWASMALALDLEQLVAKADHIVVAAAVGQKSRWDRYGHIVTDVTLSVKEGLKGAFDAGDRISVTVLGGTIGDLAMRVPGEASFKPGGSAIVFLREVSSLGELRVVGMSQGVLPLKQEPDRLVVLPAGQGQALVRKNDQGDLADAAAAFIAPLSADAMLGEIRRLVKESNAD